MTHYLGIDIGSSFTKLLVIDENGIILYRAVVKTLNRNKQEREKILEDIYSKYNIENTCATGYGRNKFEPANITKTELNCASVGVSSILPEEKTIIDIGGEDIKIIHSAFDGKVIDFYMNSKCAAGTGTFITEVAERAEIDVLTMSDLARKSSFGKELNSFCTVFAKTEIMQWIFDEIPVKDLARAIYLSIVNRIAKIRMDRSVPVFLIGGVAEYHPYIKFIMEEKFGAKVYIPEYPQMINALGAAILAKQLTNKNKVKKDITHV